MDKDTNKLNIIDLVFLKLGALLAIIAQLILYLSHGVAVVPFLSAFTNTLFANQYVGFILYLVAAVLFIIGLRKTLQSVNVINDLKIEQVIGSKKLITIMLIATAVMFIVSFIILCISEIQVFSFIMWTLSLVVLGVVWFLLDKKECFTLKINYTDIILAFILMVLAYFLYSYNLDVLPQKFHGEEAFFGLNTQSVVLSGHIKAVFSNQVLFYSLQQLFFNLFGAGVLALRMLSVMFAVLSVFVFYFWAKLLFSRKTAIVSTIILATAHLFIELSRIGDHYVSGIFILVLSLYLLTLGLKNRSYLFIYLSGIIAGFGYYLHYDAKIVVFIVLAYLILLLIKTPSIKIELLKQIGVFLCAFVLVIFPAIVKDKDGFIESYNFTPIFSKGAFDHMQQVYNTKNPLVVFVNNIGVTVKTFNSESDNSGIYGNNKPLLDFVSAILLVFGIITAFYLFKDDRYLLLLTSFFIIIFFGSILMVDPPNYPRLALILPIIALLIGSVIVKMTDVTLEFFSYSRIAKVINIIQIVIIVLIPVVLNMCIYFGYYINNNIADSKYHVPTILGNYIKTMGKFNCIYLVNFKNDPLVYSPDNETIKFLSGGEKATLIKDAQHEIPIKKPIKKDVSFIYYRYNFDKVSKLLKNTYPMGIEEIISSDAGTPVMAIYEVRQQEINSKR